MPEMPVISCKEQVAALKKTGFVEVRQKGSRVSLQKDTGRNQFAGYNDTERKK